MNLFRSSLAVCAVGAGVGLSQSSFAQSADAEPAPTFTGNIGLTSDYRFRAISQTYNESAVQGGFDYANSSGFYLGTWASNVSSDLYNNGGLELDLYGGYKFVPLPDFTIDTGIYEYYYPGAHYNDTQKTDYNNTEIYIGGSCQWFSAKYSYALTDYFGVNEHTYGNYAPILNDHGAIASAQPIPGNRGDSKGSGYLDLNATFIVADKTSLGLHAGHLDVANYGELSYTDYKISLGRDFGWATASAAAIASDAQSKWYRYCESNGTHCKNPAGGTLVLSLNRTL